MDPFELLQQSDSLAKKYLTERVYKQLRHRKTASGFTLARALRSGIKNPDSSIGIYAGDAESYSTFASLFDPVILDYHQQAAHNLLPDFQVPDLPNPDPAGRYILSTRIRLARNLKGFSFPCHLSLSQRRVLEKTIVTALKTLPGELKGTYHPFETADAERIRQLKRDQIWFKKGDRFQDAAGFNADFPKSRGVYHSSDKCSIIWLNEEDHLRIIHMEKSADIAKAFRGVGHAARELEKRFDFAFDRARGFLTSCPTNIGTTMRAGVHIRLENLEKHRDLLKSVTERHHLQIRGTGGEKTGVQQAVFDISNKQRLGVRESDIIRTLYNGISDIINTEKSL